MFLEKDWEVVEQKDVIKKQLDITKDLILSNVNGSRADAVKLRSRKKAGYPNIDRALCVPPKFDEEELSDVNFSFHYYYYYYFYFYYYNEMTLGLMLDSMRNFEK